MDNFIRFVSAVYATQLGRYLVFSGGAFIICYVLFRAPLRRFKIQKRTPQWEQYRHEVFWSLVSLLIFTLIAWSIFNPWVRPHTRIYFDIADYGWAWLAASVVIMILVHDTWFYWTHRLMHHRRLFKVFHACHHRSHSPSPWATFAFSPLEAVVQGGIIVVFAFAFPMHPLALLIWVLWMTTFNVLGHLGYEIVPAWVYRGPGRYIFNTITSHDMHHRFVRGNFSIYFRFWDLIMGTTLPNYEHEIDKIRQETLQKKNPPRSSQNQRDVVVKKRKKQAGHRHKKFSEHQEKADSSP